MTTWNNALAESFFGSLKGELIDLQRPGPAGRVAAPLAAPGAPGAWLGSRRLMAIDGVKLDVPDTPANAAGFGRPAA